MVERVGGYVDRYLAARFAACNSAMHGGGQRAQDTLGPFGPDNGDGAALDATVDRRRHWASK
jgi:hypothetical protein